MVRKLKTFVTQSGFYDLAVAAPSMKAALEAWGFTQDVFQQGFASQSDDPETVAATLVAPGIVLKRAVGTSDPFREQAAPPTTLPATAAPRQTRPARASRTSRQKPDKEQARAAILSFEKAKAAREKKQVQERKALERRHAAQARDVEVAEARLEQARQAHERRTAALQAERDRIDRRFYAEREAWDHAKGKLEAAIRSARR